MHIYSFNDLKFTLKRLKNAPTCFDHTIILREHTLSVAKVIVKKLSDLHRYVELVLWQHVLCTV